MEAIILLSLNDIENVHETCIGKLFSIKGVKEREFSVNKSGYVFEVEVFKDRPHTYHRVSYYVTFNLNNILNDF